MRKEQKQIKFSRFLKGKYKTDKLDERTQLNLLKKTNLKQSILNYFKFLCVPGYQPKELDKLNYEIQKTQSKRYVFRKFLQPLTVIGFLIILSLIIMAVYAPWLTPYDFNNLKYGYDPLNPDFSPPTADHPLGTTIMGRDVLGRLIFGSRVSLTVGLIAVSISLVLGIFFGTISAYYGGKIDNIIMRIFDLMISFPGLIFAILFVSIFGRTLPNIMIAYAIIRTPYSARFFRSSVLEQKEKLYVKAAKTSGALNFRVMFKHIFPNAISPMIIYLSYDLGSIILGIAGLGFLGVSDPDIIQWGADINIALGRLFTAPWALLWPGFFIGLTVLGFMLIGDGVRDVLDPKDIGW